MNLWQEIQQLEEEIKERMVSTVTTTATERRIKEIKVQGDKSAYPPIFFATFLWMNTLTLLHKFLNSAAWHLTFDITLSIFAFAFFQKKVKAGSVIAKNAYGCCFYSTIFSVCSQTETMRLIASNDRLKTSNKAREFDLFPAISLVLLKYYRFWMHVLLCDSGTCFLLFIFQESGKQNQHGAEQRESKQDHKTVNVMLHLPKDFAVVYWNQVTLSYFCSPLFLPLGHCGMK